MRHTFARGAAATSIAQHKNEPHQAQRPTLLGETMTERSHWISIPQRRGQLPIFLLALGMIACGPIGPFAGGRLSGEIGPAQVSDWADVAEQKTAHLESRPSDPHSVTVWFVSSRSDLFVPTSMISGTKEPSKRSWSANVAENPNVRIRIDGVVYERIATRVEDPSEFERVRALLEAKYDIQPEDRDPDRSIWLYRLSER